MKRLIQKNVWLVAIAALTSLNMLGQNNFSCGSLVPDERYVDYQDYEQNRAEEIALIKQGVQLKSGNDSLLVIPIVFHIVHQYGGENISDAQILDQIDILNEDYKKLNADTSAVNPEFAGIIGNPQLEFRLAKIDPHGNCTNGIERIYSQESVVGDDGSKMHNWPRSKYLNVWVVKDMENGVAGYAYYPSATISGFGAFIDGVIIRHDYIGSIGTGSIGRSRALTHEIGHYLSLSHVWGSTNDPGVACGDDGFDDTPVTKGWNFCPSPGSADICTPGTQENYQNYMEYSYCSHMFTMDQTAAMRAVLHLPTALRNNLWTEENLVATGVSDSLTLSPCAPIADFYPSDDFLCFGETIALNDNSYNGTPTSWSWTISGGSPSSSTSQNPTVTFSQAGWHQVSLTVSNAQGSDSKTITRSIFVGDSYTNVKGVKIDNLESYDDNNIYDFYPSADNAEENTDIPYIVMNGGTVNVGNWQLTDQVGASGSKSYLLDSYGTNGDMKDHFVTPSYDLSLVNGGSFVFKYAAATRTSDFDNITEELKVYSSVNCGDTWVPRKTIDGTDLMTGGQSGTFFYPNSDQWEVVSIPLSASLKTDGVRFKIEYTSSEYSNNLFIDDIGIEGTMGIDDQEHQLSVNVYPNPVQGIEGLTIAFESGVNQSAQIQIIDYTGKMVFQSRELNINQGTQIIQMNELSNGTQLSGGVYLLKVVTSGVTIVNQKIIVQ